MSIKDMLKFASPQRGLDSYVNSWRARNLKNFSRGLKNIIAARALKLPSFYGRLSLVQIAKDGSWVDLGLVGTRVVTTAGVNFIVDAFQDSVEMEILKYHGIGTGTGGEAVGDTALVTELTTEYNPDNTRATGSTTEAAANIYQTVGTNTVDSAVALIEHGIFSQAATGGGTLLDRTVFTVVNLGNGDSLQSTYELTVTAGG
jgi:hypothetical protein